MEKAIRVYTVAEASRLLPRFNVVLANASVALGIVERAVEQLRTRLGAPRSPDLRDHPDDPADIRALKATVRDRVAELRACGDEIETTGAHVKDLRTGLIDFYGRREGKVVWLCWQFGEPTLAHWHPLEEGFASRKPLDPAELIRVVN